MGDPVATGVFTLLGVVVTALLTTIALFIRRRWDMRDAEEARHHDVNLTLTQLKADRKAVTQQRRLEAAATFLAATHTCYAEIIAARRQRRSEVDDDAYREALHSIDGGPGQVAREMIELLFAGAAAQDAEQLWNHVRGSDVSIGVDTSTIQWARWKERYWHLRRSSIDEFRLSSTQHE